MTSKPASLNEILSKVRGALRQGGLVMEMLAELVVISQLWFEDNVIHIIAWVPDIDPQERIRYVKKKIVYDLERDQLIEMRDLQQ